MIPDFVRRLAQEHVEIADPDPRWPEMFEAERRHLLAVLPDGIIRRIEHFGSTAVPGVAAKPIVDVLVEADSLDNVKSRVVPALRSEGYDYIWRPTSGDDGPPWYAWFIRRDSAGIRTHHIHVVEADFPQWEALLFRDYLRAHSDVAAEYVHLKRRLSTEFPNDRIAYTRGKTDFIVRVTELARATQMK